MAILEQNSTESKSGFKKSIDSADIGVILNMVQVSLYQFPFKSTVREIVSNAIDSNKEKEIARLLLTGAAEISDFYVENDDPVYKDSKFNPDYYNLPYLNQSNTVNIDYYVSADMSSRDLLTFKDNGVGLGGYRLEKFFSPGASTKRLNKQALGKYGIGNKSPLSTGIGVYRLISHYNGMRFVFDIFEDKIDPIIGRFNEEGVENDYIVFENTLDTRGNPVKIYYEPTTDKNGVEIQVEVKKHNRKEIVEAVKSQLMYFTEDIIFTQHENNYSNVIPFKSSILYEDEDLIIPNDASYYNKPHFVMNNVCYGLIDFQELELNSRYGCVGIKVDPSEIDVNPSRESVAYSQKTKDTILAKYEKLVVKIEGLIKQELKVEDPLAWIKTVNSIVLSTQFTNSSNKVLSRMSGLIDKASIRPTYDVGGFVMKYESDLKSFMTSYFKVERVSVQGYSSNRKISRDNQDSMSAFNMNDIILQLGAGNAAITSYLINSSSSNSYLSIRLNFPDTFNSSVAMYHDGDMTREELDTLALTVFKEKADKERYQRAIKALDFLMLSKNLRIYDKTVVPDGYNTEDENSNIIVDNSSLVAKLRKANGKVVVGVPRSNGYNDDIVFGSMEIKLSEMPEEIWYGFTEDKKAIGSVAMLLQTDVNGNIVNNLSYVNSDLRIFRIAKNLTGKFKGYNHVNDFGYFIDNNTLKCSSPSLKNIILLNKLQKLMSHLNIDVRSVTGILRVLALKDIRYINFLSLLEQYDNAMYNLDLFANELITSAVDVQFQLFNISENVEDIDEDVKADTIDEHFHKFDKGELTDYIFDIDVISRAEYDMVLDIIELTTVYKDLPLMFRAVNITTIPHDSINDEHVLINSSYTKDTKKYLDLILEHKRQLLTRDYALLFNN